MTAEDETPTASDAGGDGDAGDDEPAGDDEYMPHPYGIGTSILNFKENVSRRDLLGGALTPPTADPDPDPDADADADDDSGPEPEPAVEPDTNDTSHDHDHDPTPTPASTPMQNASSPTDDADTDTDAAALSDSDHNLGAIGDAIIETIDTRMEAYSAQFDRQINDALEEMVTQRQLSAAMPTEDELQCSCPNKDVHINPNEFLKIDSAPELIQTVMEDMGGTANHAQIVDAMARGDPEVAEYLFPARRIGPDMPDGEYHDAPRWGIHFETKTCFHIGHATVDAEESGQFTAQIGAYDGESRFHVVDETEITVEEGKQRVNLDLRAPESGEYLLTRAENFPLRRAEYTDIEQDGFTDGLRIVGGSKPADYTKPAPFWYYYFDMEIAAHADAHATN